MNEATFKKRSGAALIGVASVALAGGYLLHGKIAEAQPGAATTSAPVVQTAATRDASAIQNAFAQVSDAVEPAVVTITTSGKAAPAGARRSPFGSPFGGIPKGSPPSGGSPNAPGSGDNDPMEEFFKQFNQKFGFQPNRYQRDAIRARLQPIQRGGGSGGGLGSGMIFRSDGYIMTNAHVVKGADPGNITVKLADDREFRHVQLVGIDEGTDIAVLKIKATNLPTVKLGDSSGVKVGDWAIAIGNPFGLDHTVTVGIISAKAREVQLSDRGGDYLQTDASINPGNSGGPLCDINGRVVGVNNAIYSESGGNMGIGFAIPINTARDIAEQLVKNGKITRGYLGVMIQSLDARNAASYGLDESTKGVLVAKVTKDTPGARAGLEEGDVIVAFNGKKVSKSNELQGLVGAAPVGSTVKLTVLRAGKNVCAAFYGHPGVFAWSPHKAIEIARKEGYRAHMEPGISAEDCLYADLGIDPGKFGCQHFEASQLLFYKRRIDPTAYLVLWQVGMVGDQTLARFATDNAYRQVLVDRLAENYPLNHRVIIYRAATLPIHPPRIERTTLRKLATAHIELPDTIVIPPARKLEPNTKILQRLTKLAKLDEAAGG